METREYCEGVRFDDFALVAKLAGWDAQGLAELFTGKIEQPLEFFRRVLALNPDPNKGHPRPDSAIPYRSVIAKFIEMRNLMAADGRLRVCSCGCGRPIARRGANRFGGHVPPHSQPLDGTVTGEGLEGSKPGVMRCATQNHSTPGFITNAPEIGGTR